MNKPDKLPLRTPDLTERNYAALAALFPNAVTETINENGVVVRAIDADVLRQEINAHVVEGKEERYQFTWPDKKKAVLLANAPIAATLRPCREESVDFDNTENLYIEGDNLDVLKLLRETYLNRVKMIYIDPPYNTGNDFIYEDDFAEDTGEFLARDGQRDENGNRMVRNLDSNGRFHTDWLNMMYPRLRVAKDLLTDDGVIFISIDDNEIGNLRKMADQIFGENNFIANLIWQKKYTRANDAKYFSDNHDHILCYGKNKQAIILNMLPRNDEQLSAYSNPDNHPKGIWKATPLHAKSGTNTSEYTFNNGILWNPPVGTYRRFNDESMKKMDDNNEIWFGSDGLQTPSRKSFLCDVKDGVTPITLWLYDEVGHNHEANNELKTLELGGIFSNPKPTRLLKQALILATKPNGLVLDFFSGSATTAHAVMQLNAEDGGKRKFIMVQLDELTYDGKKEKYRDKDGKEIERYIIDQETGYPIIVKDSEARKAGYYYITEIGKERIRRAGAKISGELPVASGQQKLVTSHPSLATNHSPLDTGFRVLKLDSSNMQEVYYTPQDTVSASGSPQRNLYELVDNIKPDRSAEDLLFQVMLDLGIPLSAKIEKRVFSGQWLVASEKPAQGQTVFFVDPASTSPSPLVTNNSSLSSSPSSLATSHYLIACFDRVTDAIVTEIAKSKPYYAVFRDSGFASDATLANFEQIFKTYSPSTIRKVL